MSIPVCNREVVNAWINGEDARNHRRTFTSSNGRLKSYDEVIGVNMGGTCIIRDATVLFNDYIMSRRYRTFKGQYRLASESVGSD